MSRLLRHWPLPALFAALLVVLGPALAMGKLLAYGDALVQDFPLRLLAVSAWHQGVVPFWNPFSFGGMPLLATIHVGVFYPGNWSFLFLPPVAAMNVTVLTAYWVAGVGAYMLARAQGLPRGSAFASGLVFMGCGFMVSHLENLQIVQAASLMPWILWAIARHAEAADGRYARAFALLLALQVLAGHPQMTVYTGLVALAYTAWLARRAPRRLSFLAGLGAGCGLGLGLALLQLLPTLAFIPVTQRAAISYDQLTFRALPLHQLITLWFPYAYGVPGGTPEYWGAPTFTDVTGYAGLVTLVLAALALLVPATRRPAAFWAAVAVAAALLAAGPSTPLVTLIAALPVLNTLPAPGRHMFEADLALAVLAALGLEAWATADRLRRPLLAWALAGLPVLAVAAYVGSNGPAIEQRLALYLPPDLLPTGAFSLTRPAYFVPIALWVFMAGVAVTFGLREQVRRAAVLVLLAGDLTAFALAAPWAVRSINPPQPLMPPSQALAENEARIFPVSSAFVYPYHDLDSIRALRYPDWGSLAGVRSLTGYDAFVSARYSHVMGRMQSTGVAESPELWWPGHHGPDLLGVRRILLDPVMANTYLWDQRRVARGLVPAGGELGVTWLANPRALPRAWRLVGIQSALPGVVDRHVMRDAAFEPAHLGYLDLPDRLAAAPVPGTASAHTPDFNHIVVETHGAGPGLVAVSEGYDAGWRAWTADGRELPVHRLDALILGVEVPAGDQHVTLAYEPPGWRAGLAGTALAAMLWGAWAWWDRRRRLGAP